MALTIGQKTTRVTNFLRGVTRPRVADALVAFGFTLAISVSTFLQRVRALGAQGGGAAEALAILKARGLTDEVLAEADALLAKFGTVEFSAPTAPDPVAEQAERLEAENAMWGWYLEWSTIARNVIHSRALLRRLGFLVSGGDRSEDEGEDLGAIPVNGNGLGDGAPTGAG